MVRIWPACPRKGRPAPPQCPRADIEPFGNGGDQLVGGRQVCPRRSCGS
jgi:hypothetical protein